MHGCKIQKYEYHSGSEAEEGQENSFIGSGVRVRSFRCPRPADMEKFLRNG